MFSWFPFAKSFTWPKQLSDFTTKEFFRGTLFSGVYRRWFIAEGNNLSALAGTYYDMEPIEKRTLTRDPGDEMRLVARIRAGDQHAMSELYDRYSKVVYAVALRVLQDAAGAEDVLQDVFLQLWRNPDAFDASRGSLAAWLAVIARHRSIDRLRKRRPETDIEDCVIASGPDLRDETERALLIEKVRGALEAMSPEQRQAMELAFFQGLTHTEIAEKTGEPLGTIKTRIRSGLQQLRAKFAS